MNQKEINAIEIESILNLEGQFYWSFDKTWFITTSKGNFIWDDANYGGSNTITRTHETFNEWIKRKDVFYSRYKGQHVIRKYCGDDVQVILT